MCPEFPTVSRDLANPVLEMMANYALVTGRCVPEMLSVPDAWHSSKESLKGYRGSQGHGCAGQFYDSSTLPTDIWEEEPSTEKIPVTVGKPLGHFLD